MKFNTLGGKLKIFKKISYVLTLMMALFTFGSPVNVFAGQNQGGADEMRPGTATERGISAQCYPDNNSAHDYRQGLFSYTITPGEQGGSFASDAKGVEVPTADQKNITDNLTYSYHGQDSTYVDFDLSNSRFEVAYVIVKGGDGYNEYDYTSVHYQWDKNLHSPEFKQPNENEWKLRGISHVTFYFRPAVTVPKGRITVMKVWNFKDNPETEMSRPTFTLKNSSGQSVSGQWDNEHQAFVFSELPFGTYTLSEAAVEGFTPKFQQIIGNESFKDLDIIDQAVSIDVEDTEKIEILVTNTLDTGKVHIVKSWEYASGDEMLTPPPIEGSLFQIVNDKTGDVREGIPEEGRLDFTNLPLGKYSLYEAFVWDSEWETPTFIVDGKVVSDEDVIQTELGYKIPLEITKEGQVVNVEITNTEDPEGRIIVTKQWNNPTGTAPSQLPDPLFTLKDRKGNVIQAAKIGGPLSLTAAPQQYMYVFENLPKGVYTLTEAQVAGYDAVFKKVVEGGDLPLTPQTAENGDKSVSITLGNDETAEINVINSLGKGSIHITKTWKDGFGQSIAAPSLEGKQFKLVTKAGETVASDNPVNGVLNFTNLYIGEYTLIETCPDIYTPEFKINNSTVPFTKSGLEYSIPVSINSDGQVVNVDVTNSQPAYKGYVVVKKFWKDSDGRDISAPVLNLEGSLFTLTGKNVEYVKNANPVEGVANFTDLPVGDYTLFEAKTAGYTPEFRINNAVITSVGTTTAGYEIALSINKDSRSVTVEITNKKDASPVIKGSINVKKVWKDSNGSVVSTPNLNLDGMFTLKKAGATVAQGKPDTTNSYQFTNLDLGSYTIAEKQFSDYETSFVVNGATVKAAELTLTLTSDTKTIEVTIINTHKPETVPVISDGGTLPVTDVSFGEEFFLILLGAISLIIGAGFKFKRYLTK